MRRMMALLSALLLCRPGASTQTDTQGTSLLIVSWNVENFFDCTDEGGGESDRAHTPAGERHWTQGRLQAKCNGIAKVLLLIGARYGRMPDAIALQEVENRRVLQRLLASTVLCKLDYTIVHADSPDRRGIDCALLCRKSTLPLLRSSTHLLRDSCGQLIPTRAILLAECEGLALLVNHHPSRIGNGSRERRQTAMQRLTALCDSLEAAGQPHILAVGDFNDTLWGADKPGTIKYHGSWEKIDGFFQRGLPEIREDVFADACLSEADKRYGGQKPARTYAGPRYLGGLSDHYPIVLLLRNPL